jgi:hypothetical protein
MSAIRIDIFGEQIFDQGLIYITSKCSQFKNMNLRRISDACTASPYSHPNFGRVSVHSWLNVTFIGGHLVP